MNRLDLVMVHCFLFPCEGELICQSDPLADTLRMHLSHCQQLVSSRLLVKFACYRLDTFKLQKSRWSGPRHGGKTEGWAPCVTPPVLLWPSIMAVRAAVLLFFSGGSKQSSTSSGTLMEVQASAQTALIRGCAFMRKVDVTDINLYDRADAERFT